MHQYVQNTFENDLKVTANDQVHAHIGDGNQLPYTLHPRGLEAKIPSFYIYDQTLGKEF